MTIRIEGGSIRSKGRRPRNGTFILPLFPPCFSSSPDEWKLAGQTPRLSSPVNYVSIASVDHNSNCIRIESRRSTRWKKGCITHPSGEISKTPRSRILWQNFFEKTFYSASEETRRACKVSTPFHFPTIFLFCLHLPFFSPFMRSGRKWKKVKDFLFPGTDLSLPFLPRPLFPSLNSSRLEQDAIEFRATLCRNIRLIVWDGNWNLERQGIHSWKETCCPVSWRDCTASNLPKNVVETGRRRFEGGLKLSQFAKWSER